MLEYHRNNGCDSDFLTHSCWFSLNEQQPVRCELKTAGDPSNSGRRYKVIRYSTIVISGFLRLKNLPCKIFWSSGHRMDISLWSWHWILNKRTRSKLRGHVKRSKSPMKRKQWMSRQTPPFPLKYVLSCRDLYYENLKWRSVDDHWQLFTNAWRTNWCLNS